MVNHIGTNTVMRWRDHLVHARARIDTSSRLGPAGRIAARLIRDRHPRPPVGEATEQGLSTIDSQREPNLIDIAGAGLTDASKMQ